MGLQGYRGTEATYRVTEAIGRGLAWHWLLLAILTFLKKLLNQVIFKNKYKVKTDN